MSNFGNLKKNSAARQEALLNKLNEQKGKSYEDDRFWKLSKDKVGNGYAVIRFLSAADGEDCPWVQVWSHSVQGKGGWFIENCPTTLEQKCPCCEANTELWNSGIESDKEIVRKRKRKLQYISNILVISDPSNPENDGKVFLFKYGAKIFDKLRSSMEPEFQDETKIDPFDFWKGRDFKLKMRQVEGYPNYDKSELSPSSALFDGDDKKIEKLWNSLYKLQEFVSPDQFKSYDVLKARFHAVIAGSTKTTTSSAQNVAEDSVEKPTGFAAKKAASTGQKPVNKTEPAPFDSTDEEVGDNSLEYFKKLAEED